MRYFFVPISAVILVILSISESANILILHPIYCGSHEFVLRNLGDYLIKKGHSVTQVCMLIHGAWADFGYLIICHFTKCQNIILSVNHMSIYLLSSYQMS